MCLSLIGVGELSFQFLTRLKTLFCQQFSALLSGVYPPPPKGHGASSLLNISLPLPIGVRRNFSRGKLCGNLVFPILLSSPKCVLGERHTDSMNLLPSPQHVLKGSEAYPSENF
jgi:hypothetical protein